MAASKKTIWDLALEITGDDKNASTALRQVKKNIQDVQAAGKQLGNDFKNFASNAGKLALGVAGGITAVTAGVITMANSFAEAGDKAAKTSAALGIGIEAYQELTYAMGQSGLSAQEFDSALQKFNLTVRQGAAGNEAMARQLESVGLCARKLAGMAPEQAFERISDYLQTLPNDAERTRVAVTLFGKTAGPKMMAAMAQGSEGLRQLGQEARDLGIIISDEQARASEEYLDAQSRLKQSFTGMKNQFIGSAIGPLTEAFDHLKNAMVEQMPAVRELGQKFGQWLGELVRRLPDVIAKIKEFGAWIKETVNRVVDFVGGWKNVAKILAGLAIAPTLISGLKVLFSLGKFIKVAFTAIGPILTGLKTAGLVALKGIAVAAAPVIAIIAAIAAVVITIIRNFQELKAYALNCIAEIKSAFGGGANSMNVDWEKVKEVALLVWEIIERVIVGVLKNVMAAITGAIKIIINAVKVVWNVFAIVFEAIKTIITVVVKIFQGDFEGAFQAIQNFLGVFKERFSNIMEAIKNIFGAIGDFFKAVFGNAIEVVMTIVDKLADKFGGVFEKIRAVVQGFVDFFKKAFEGISNVISGVGNFLGGIGEKVGGLFGRNRSSVPGHAEGGIFRTRHIAEIAEKGAEAVVPLNKSQQGFDIWRQAGEIAGYMERMSQQSATETSAVSRPATPPIMQAAAQRVSGGDNVINVNFTQNNTFSGASPSGETINQISAAGQQAADDFEIKVKAALDKIIRNQNRVSYA